MWSGTNNNAPILSETKERLEKELEQLKVDVALEREKVSVVSKDLTSFTETHKEADFLLRASRPGGNDRPGENPYVRKHRCTLL